jgi:hypothetical protein
MSDIFGVKTQPGYEGLGTGNGGSASAMAWLDKATGAAALLLDVGLAATMCAHAVYTFANDGGATGVVVPKWTALIPAGAILVGSYVNSPTAFTGSGSISVGTSAGSSATSILGATAYGTFTTDYVAQGVVTASSPVKMSAQGNIELTFSGTITAGVLEVFVLYVMPANI